MMRLKIQEKILLHLYDYRKYVDRYEYPIEMTQQGIAKVVGISVTHVPRNIKRLLEEGLVESKKGHVAGKKKRITVYFLTHRGIAEAKRIIEEIKNQEVQIGGATVTVEELKRKLNMRYLDIVLKLEKGEITEDLLGMEKRIVFSEVNVRVESFVDRRRELREMEEWYREGKFLAIVGGKGTGKTYLVAKFVEDVNPKESVVWIDVYPGRRWSTVKEVMRSLFGKSEILSILRAHPTLLIFDGYYDVDDEFVSALNSLTREELGPSKVIVTMRTDTPFYNRFYTLADVAESRVREIRIEGLPYEEARRLMPDVKESAFKRIYQLSRGNPRILSALVRGNIEEEDVPLMPDQIHLLKYLAEQKK